MAVQLCSAYADDIKFSGHLIIHIYSIYIYVHIWELLVQTRHFVSVPLKVIYEVFRPHERK